MGEGESDRMVGRKRGLCVSSMRGEHVELGVDVKEDFRKKYMVTRREKLAARDL